jgi:capsular polysaccharide biosynthesis protein
VKNFSNKLGVFLLILLFVEVVIFGIDSFRTPEYQSTAKYVVILDREEGGSLDSYTLSMAAGHLAGLTVELIDTTSFIREVYQRSGLIHDLQDIEEARKRIEAEVVEDTEVVKVSVIDKVPERSQKICQTIVDTLETEVENTNWSQENFNIGLIDQPILPQRPISPNLSRDLIAGFLAVLMVAVFYSLFREED